MEINLSLEHYKVLLNWYELLFASREKEPTEIEIDTLAILVQMMKQEIRNHDFLDSKKD